MEDSATRDGEEELALFLEMRRHEKDQGVSPLPSSGLNNGDDTSTESSVTKTGCSAQRRRTAVEKFLDSENDKSDYDWLIAVPEMLQPEKEPQKDSAVEHKKPNPQPAVLQPRLGNIPEKPVSRNVKASKPINVGSGPNSTAVNRRTITSGEPKPRRRTATPAATKSSKQVTPTQRATSPATIKLNGARSTRSTPRSSTPTGRTLLPSNMTPRSATPTPMPSTARSAPNPPPSALTRSSSVGKSVPSASSKASKLSNVPKRPVSASRGRGASRTYSSAAMSHAGERSRVQSKTNNDVNPVLMGTQMVERVVNMRRLSAPKQDDHSSAGKSASSIDGSGFGRTLSRSSLDMALRHMDIRRSISGNLRVTINKVPAHYMNNDD